jgi:uncharacterized protein (DUF2336 family)
MRCVAKGFQQVSSVEFRQISMGKGRRDGDRLFSAAISAFCSLPRPTSQDIDQLEDLVMPLFRQASEKTLRFACASLSECKTAPIGLVRALCHEKSEICAPLLVRYEGFTEADLITMISRHGIGHARIIAHRKKLHPVVRDLLIAQGNEEIAALLESKVPDKAEVQKSTSLRQPGETNARQTGKAERVRSQLRTMLAQNDVLENRPTHIGDEHIKLRQNLRSTAFLDNPAFFETALADALGIDFGAAKTATSSGSWQRLAVALKALNISDSEAFLLAFAKFPGLFTSPQRAEGFLDHYQKLSREIARKETLSWTSTGSEKEADAVSGVSEPADKAKGYNHEAANAGGTLRQAS